MNSHATIDKVASSKPLVWIIEDEAVTAYNLKKILDNSFVSVVLKDMNEIKKHLTDENQPELVVADLRLGDDDLTHHPEVFNKLTQIKTIVISAHDDLETIRKCFTSGAIDFLTKPIGGNEILIKISKLLNNGSNSPYLLHDQSELKIDPIEQSFATREGKKISLTPKELKIASCFLNSEGWRLKRATLTKSVWGEKKVSQKTLDIHLFNLRLKLKGIGYEIAYQTGGYYKLRKSSH